tara:strand:- start:478 stop:774 length:297 start_codon:yes stop_codon:yes gene_type:complete
MSDQQNSSYRLPSDSTMKYALKIAITEDKPIMMDYWVLSLDKKVLIGVKENGEKLLVKSQEEYTSPICNLYKSNDDMIIKTENSIYLVSSNIPNKKIQ